MNVFFSEKHKEETFKSMIEISRDVYKYLILLNGGAVAGMVATLDKIVHIVDAQTIRCSMGAFILGLALAVLAVVFAWIVQNILHNENIEKKPEGTHIKWVLRTFVIVLLSLFSFSYGAFKAVNGISS